MIERPRSFEEWQGEMHESVKADPLWNFIVYPKTLFLYDLVWSDCDYLLKDERGRAVARQLIRSAGSIRANIEEGFGRGYGPDYAYRLRIAMGEARESCCWYWGGRKLLPADVLDHCIALLDEIIALLAPNIKRQSHMKPNK